MTSNRSLSRFTRPSLAAALLLLAAGPALAHTGHGADTLFQGLAHPLGLDHLLAMVAVGLWSARALPGAQRWAGPAVFMLAMAAGGLLGAAGLMLPGLESAIALSVAMFGAMLVWAHRLPAAAGLAAVAAAALLHGLAHGAEGPGSAGFMAYAAGFLATTAALHAAGLLAATRLHKAGPRLWAALGAGLGLASVALLMLRA
jgi:urease accessory protein